MGTALTHVVTPIDDPLAYLPNKGSVEYKQGSVIFDETTVADRIYLVIKGLVGINIRSSHDTPLLLGLCPPDTFFGEAGLISLTHTQQRACALQDCVIMSWSSWEIDREVERQPRLGLAMTQVLTSMCLELQERLQGLALDKTPERVIWALIHLCKKLGVPQENGSLRITGITHETIADYIGTSREIVTCNMNLLRDQHLIDYSRRSISVHKMALEEHLRHRRLVQAGLIRD